MVLAVLCLTYVVGLLSTGIALQVWGVGVGAIAFPIMGIVAALILPCWWRSGPRRKIWFLAGIIGLAAVLYFQLRFPKPAGNDVSQLLKTNDDTAQVEVTGFITTSPRLTRSGRIQFELEPFQVGVSLQRDQQREQTPAMREVSGKVYVTLQPSKEALMPLEIVTVTGELYRPKPASNPGGFDFEAYLEQRGIFAGIRGRQIDFPEREGRFRSHITWRRSVNRAVQQSFWRVRQRIVKAQAEGLQNSQAFGNKLGPLVSAMLLGKGAVDVDFDLRDLFSRVGLAHALAASGFQVSLLLSILLRLTGTMRQSLAIALCGTGLLVYIGLTGLEPSVVRAGLMGGAVLLGLAMERAVKPLGALVAVATLILLVNPIWIWDLGFQLSFLATLGLIVTVPILDQWLDWLPPAIASLISVPLAAYVWTLPVQLFAFGVVSPYSILLNIVTALLITLISLGSGISGLAALVYAPVGSILAMVLLLPSEMLVHLASWVNSLPGNAFATGTISATQGIALLSLYGLLWWRVGWWKRWWMVGIVCFMLVAVPAANAQMNRVQVTVLATKQPVMVVQQRGRVGVIGSSDRSDTQFTVLPFLRQQGINRIDWAIAPATANPEGWMKLLKTVPIQRFYRVPTDLANSSPQTATLRTELDQQMERSLQAKHGKLITLDNGQPVETGADPIEFLSLEPTVVQLHVGEQNWLLTSKMTAAQEKQLQSRQLPDVDVLWWAGGKLSPALLQKIRPEVAIASQRRLSPAMQKYFQQHQMTGFATGQDGAVQWTPERDFVTILSAEATEVTTE